ncbi:hypothetical protein H2201_002175 [Coniosporium apollinis]|uniref:Uncharacterized protein n=1 Tax=Coniosporium apollinis TaxID=61459 RepID=A0ABQ9NZ40_9PEZI|nr:hypothetical protein H2201_002175 [Coniosporium apollinis]
MWKDVAAETQINYGTAFELYQYPLKNAKRDEDENILAQLLVTPPQTIEVLKQDPFNGDPVLQGQLDDALTAKGLSKPQDLLDEAKDGLSQGAAGSCSARLNCSLGSNSKRSTILDSTFGSGDDEKPIDGWDIACSDLAKHLLAIMEKQCALIKFKGTIKVVLETGEMKSTDITASMTSIIDLIVGTEAHGPSSGCWRYTLDVTPLKNIAVTNIFSISPKIIDTLGIDYETDSAVNVVGGASMKLNNAAVRLDMKAKTASDIVNWQPQSNLTYPLFKSASKVRLTSFMRTSIDLSISVLNAQLQDLATLTSETVFDARTLDLLIAGREPTKVSYACLQIATGTVTASVYGSTSTTYSGVSTSTVTQTVGEQGPLAIETELWRQSLATEVTATKGVVTSTKAGSRPLQTQLSCFTLTSHGRPHIEGKALGFQQGGDFLSLGYRIIEPAVFFLTSNGTLVAYPEPSTPGSQEPRVLCGPGSPD